MMISPHKLRGGTLASATGFSLLLPVAPSEDAFLVGYGKHGELVGIFLAGRFALCIQPVGKGSEWGGLLLDDVRVEVDASSAFSLDTATDTLGAVRVSEAGVHLIANASADPQNRNAAPVRLSDQPPGDATMTHRVFFSSWSVVTGEGREKITLWQHPPEAQRESRYDAAQPAPQ